MAASVNDELSAGIEMGFPILGYRGKVWSIRHRGEERTLMRPDGDGPRNSVEVVILKAGTNKSKIWYQNGYVEGSTEAPDCFSTNGLTPDPQSKAAQCTTCAACPHNQWGSRITPAGKKGKACQDAKRAAIAPLQDIPNEMFGGPMLLRVPAASLQALATYAEQLKGMGYHYFAVGTRISFVATESYPKFEFSPIRLLTDAEAEQVLHFRDSAQVQRILAEGETFAAPQQAPVPALQFEQPPQPQPQQQAVQQTVQAPAPQQTVVQPQQAAAMGGFGVTAPAQQVQQTQQVQAPVVQPAPAAPVQTVTPEVTTAPAAAPSGAEQSFDAKLDALLG